MVELEIFRRRLRLKMRQRRLTQEALGAALEPSVHRNTVKGWLKEGRGPSLVQFIEISQILGVSGRWLLGLSENESPPSYLTAHELECLTYYRRLPDHAQRALCSVAQETLEVIERASG